VPNERKSLLENGNRALNIHIIPIKNQSVPFIPESPTTSHKYFHKARNVKSSFAIKDHIKNGELSIPLQIQIPPEPLAKVTGKEKVNKIFNIRIFTHSTETRWDVEMFSVQEITGIKPILQQEPEKNLDLGQAARFPNPEHGFWGRFKWR
jgi:hypothetical protein